MSKWVTKKVSEIGEVISGATPKTDEPKYWDGEIVWITPNDMSKLRTPFVGTSLRKISQSGLANCSAHLLPKGTLVLSSRAPIGYLAVTRTELATNQGCKSIIFFKENDPLFHYYNFLQNVDRLKQLGEGTTFSEFSKAYLENFTISYPADPTEQARIAKILSTVDTAIEQTETLIDKYSRIRTGLMQDLLTRGIDEHGRIRSEETHEFKDSPLGRIPKEWGVVKLEEVVSAIDPQPDHRTPSSVPIGYPYLGISDFLEDGNIDFNSCRTVSRAALEKQKANFSVSDGDIIFGKIGTIGKPKKLPPFSDYALSANVILLKPKITPEYVFQLLKSSIIIEQVKNDSHLTSQPAFGMEKIRNLTVAIPQQQEREKIAVILSKQQKALDSKREALRKFQILKKGLMQDLLSGPKPEDQPTTT